MTGHLNYYLAQQLIDERLRVARKRQASLHVAKQHKRQPARVLASLLQSRTHNHPTQRRAHAEHRHRSH